MFRQKRSGRGRCPGPAGGREKFWEKCSRYREKGWIRKKIKFRRERFRRIILCRQNFDRIAERAMELLLSMLESPQNPVPAMEEVPAESFPEF